LARNAGSLRVTRPVTWDAAARRAAARCNTARLAPRRAPLPVLAALRAATKSCRLAPLAAMEKSNAKAAAAATAGFMLIITLPEFIECPGSAR
jgi:hypothetical protein